jgi:hypothetical protein
MLACLALLLMRVSHEKPLEATARNHFFVIPFLLYFGIVLFSTVWGFPVFFYSGFCVE